MSEPASAATSAAANAAGNSAPRVVAVIPARLASTRLPRKVLLPVAGQPLLVWVHAAASRCPQFAEVIVAADSDEVAALCRARGWRFLMTDPALPSGTDRLHAVAQTTDAEIFVNVQGDEPLLEPAHIPALLSPFAAGVAGPAGPAVDVTTLRVACAPEDAANPNVVKVVCALDGRALYFSRAPIPHPRDPGAAHVRPWKHLGLYAYRRHALERFAALPPSPLEMTERLEQLRLLENGLTLYVATTQRDTVGVDTPEDLRRVERLLRTRR